MLTERIGPKASLIAFSSFLEKALLYAMIFFIPFRYRIALMERPVQPVWKDYTDFLLFIPDVLMILGLALWAVRIVYTKRPVSLGRSYIWIPLALLTLLGWVSLFTSVDPGLTLYHCIRISVLFFLYLYLVNETKNFVLLGWAALLQGLVQSVVAALQYFHGGSVGLQFLGEYELKPEWPGVSVVTANGIRYLRAYGLSDHPNILGGCIAFCLIVIFSLYLYGSGKYRLVWAFSFPFLLAGLFVTFSRSAWLAFAGCSLFLLISGFKSSEVRKRFIVLSGLSLLLLLPMLWGGRQLLASRAGVTGGTLTGLSTDESMRERLALFRAANTVFSQNALFGIGLGASPQAMRDYFPEFEYNYQPPHFVFLAVALETGLFGSLMYLILMLAPVLVFAALYKRRAVQPAHILVSALGICIVIIGFFDYYTWLLLPGRIWQWLFWGMWSAVFEKDFNYELG